MSDYPGAAWFAQYRERVNGDAELNVIGRLRPGVLVRLPIRRGRCSTSAA